MLQHAYDAFWIVKPMPLSTVPHWTTFKSIVLLSEHSVPPPQSKPIVLVVPAVLLSDWASSLWSTYKWRRIKEPCLRGDFLKDQKALWRTCIDRVIDIHIHIHTRADRQTLCTWRERRAVTELKRCRQGATVCWRKKVKEKDWGSQRGSSIE